MKFCFHIVRVIFYFQKKLTLLTVNRPSNNPSQLQHALDCFSSWICEYQLCLATAKWAHVAFSRHMANNIQNVFHINSEPVQTTSKVGDLGVLVTDNLKWSSHISHIHSVASHLSYIVLHAFSTKNIWTLLKIYVTYNRPKLEYNSSVWSPYLKKDIKLIESVQKRLTRNVFIRCNLPFNSYEDRLTKLGMKSSEYCKLECDLILMYKISHNLCDLNFSDYPLLCISNL